MRLSGIILNIVIILDAYLAICNAASFSQCGNNPDGGACCTLSSCPVGMFRTRNGDVNCVSPTTSPPTTVPLPTDSGNVTVTMTPSSNSTSVFSTTQFSNTTTGNDTNSTTVFATSDPDSAAFVVDIWVCVSECPEGFYGNRTILECIPCDAECVNCTGGPSTCDSCINGTVTESGSCENEAAPNTGLAVGLAVGSVVVIGLIVITVCWCCRRRHRNDEIGQMGMERELQRKRSESHNLEDVSLGSTDGPTYVNIPEIKRLQEDIAQTQDKILRYVLDPTQSVKAAPPNGESPDDDESPDATYDVVEPGYGLDRKVYAYERHEISQLPVAPCLPLVVQSDDSPINYGYDVLPNPTKRFVKTPGTAISPNASSTEQLVKTLRKPEIGNVNEAYDYPRKVSDITRQFERKVAPSEQPLVSHGATEPQPHEAQHSYEPMAIVEENGDQIYENFDRKDGDLNEDYYNVNEIRGSNNKGQDDDELYYNDVAPTDDDQGNYEEMTGRG